MGALPGRCRRVWGALGAFYCLVAGVGEQGGERLGQRGAFDAAVLFDEQLGEEALVDLPTHMGRRFLVVLVAAAGHGQRLAQRDLQPLDGLGGVAYERSASAMSWVRRSISSLSRSSGRALA